MSRYIDADALIEFIDMGHYRNPLELCYSEQYVVDMIESRPTADVVEVVHCEHCMFNHWHTTPNGEKYHICNMNKLSFSEHADFFCKYGERREDE